MVSGEGGWAGEAAVVEALPLLGGKGGSLGVGGDFVEAGFVVVVAHEEGLGGVMG